jgi:hypothetical protein
MSENFVCLWDRAPRWEAGVAARIVQGGTKSERGEFYGGRWGSDRVSRFGCYSLGSDLSIGFWIEGGFILSGTYGLFPSLRLQWSVCAWLVRMAQVLGKVIC